MGMKLSNPSLPINGVDEVDVYVRWNAPVEVSKTASRWIVFQRAESGSDGSDDGHSSGMEGTTSSGDVDSKRAQEALLAGDSYS